MKYDVIYEDNHLLVVNKPIGWLSQGDKTNDQTITDPYKKYIKEKYNKPGDVFLHPAHRLDRPVSGCLILGRTTKGLNRITKLFSDNSVSKEYLAIVHGEHNTSKETLKHWLLKDHKRNRTKCYKQEVTGSKYAHLEYRVVHSLRNSSILIVEPRTGRSHQIRTQLAQVGLPIVGDMKYGSPRALSNKGIALHCLRMRFKHPTKDEVITVSSLPPLIHSPWDNYKRICESI